MAEFRAEPLSVDAVRLAVSDPAAGAIALFVGTVRDHDHGRAVARLSYSAPSADGGGQVERRTESAGGDKLAKVGRNAPCPCGSGRKYKLCHGDPRNRANG